MTSLWITLPLLAVLLALSAFFSGSETAFFSLQRETVLAFRKDLRRGANRVAQLLETPRELLATILFGNLIVNVLFYSTTAVIAYGLARAGSRAYAALVGAGGLLAVVIFGEVVPKAAALAFRTRVSVLSAEPLFLIYTLLRPVRYAVGALVKALTAVALRVVGPPGRITREELSMLVEVTRAQGHIPPQEGEMIEEVMGLSETRLREVMVPRVDVVAIPAAADIDELLDLFAGTRRTKIPVYRGDLDHIDGIAQVKRALLEPVKDLSEVIEKPLYVPEVKTVEGLLREFQGNRAKMAVVVDEYGGTAGIVTLTDLVAEIVGPLGDEYDQPETLVEEIGAGRYRLAGDLSIKEWNELFDVDLDNEKLSTLGGFVIYLLGRVPRKGDAATYRNVIFTVEEVHRHRIRSLIAELVEETDAGRRGEVG
ncbi:MAG: hemolysin family protein [Planctomycetota bacterium]|jgi:putative hemolysin